MKKLILNFILLFAIASPAQKLFRTSIGQNLYYLSDIQDQQQATLILLPGIYRGYLPNEDMLKLFSQNKINWVSIHFSRHPLSIIEGNNHFLGPINATALTQEVLELKNNLKIRKPILVSLSFSGSLSPYWHPKSFPYLIETSPMGRHDETLEKNETYENWQEWMSFFPIWGPWLVQSHEYWAYRGHWLNEIRNLSQKYPAYYSYQYQLAEGLAQLAWSSRGFDIRKQEFSKGPQRFWILGENEDPRRLKYQMEAVRIYEKLSGEKRLTLISNSGHNIPQDQPSKYLIAIKKILKQIESFDKPN